MNLYEVTFTSWENDGDDYATVGKFLTSQADVDFYLNLANKFTSTNSSSSGFGNEEVDNEILEEVVQELIDESLELSQEVKNEWLNVFGEEYGVYDKICEEILSDPVQYDYGFCRVLESSNVNKIISGQWIKVGDKEVIFESFENNMVKYRFSQHPKHENGHLDIFKLEWKFDFCGLNDFTTIRDADEISKAVLNSVIND
jgi:hypothetical protein